MEEIIDFTRYIEVITHRTPCKRHNKSQGFPCWTIESGVTRNIKFAVCNKRALTAGFVGAVSQRAMQRNYTKKA